MRYQTALIPVICYLYMRSELKYTKIFLDAPSGIEPELFGIKIRRVAYYTKGQYEWWASEVSILPRERIRFTV